MRPIKHALQWTLRRVVGLTVVTLITIFAVINADVSLQLRHGGHGDSALSNSTPPPLEAATFRTTDLQVDNTVGIRQLPSPTAVLSMTDVETGGANMAQFNSFSGDGTGAKFNAVRGRGTPSAPSSILQTDDISDWSSYGLDTTLAPARATLMTSGADFGVIAPGVVPGLLTWWTANSAGALTKAMSIASNQDVHIFHTMHVDGLETLGGGITGLPTTTCIAGQAMTASSTTGAGTCSAVGSGTVGPGTVNTLAMFTGATTVGDSPLVYDGTSTLSTTKRMSLQSLDLSNCQAVAAFAGGTVQNDFSPVGWATHTCFKVQGGAHWGDVITGLDTTGIVVGDIRIIYNDQPQGFDAPIVFSHFDTRSLIANRLWLPEQNAAPGYTQIGPLSWAMFQYTFDENNVRNVWTQIATSSERAVNLIGQSLQVSAPITIGPIGPGTINDWDPTGNPVLAGPWCQAGNQCEGANSTSWGVEVDAGGATITGIKWPGITKPGGQGPIKFICNLGPGKLTLTNHDIASAPNNQFDLPASSYTMPACNTFPATVGCCGVFFHNTLSSVWFMLGGTSPGNGLFPSLQSQTSIMGPAITPALLAAGTTNNWDPTGVGALNGTPLYSYVRAQTTGTATAIVTGMVGPGAGLSPPAPYGFRMRICSFGTGPIRFTNLDAGSSVGNKYFLPGTLSGNTTLTLQYGDCQDFTYDQGGWWFAEGSNSNGDHPGANGTTPGLSGCGGAGIAISGDDHSGTVTEGAAAAGCTITFANAWNAFNDVPHCTVTSEAGLVFSYAVSRASITITNVGALAGTILDYRCN